MSTNIDPTLAIEAKVIVALAFRNGPIEDLHAGRICPTCSADSNYSRISNDEMKEIMKQAVNKVYSLLWQREDDSEAYAKSLILGKPYSSRWDDPEG